MSKAAKGLQAGKMRCGGYKEEPENLTFAGDSNDNPMEFLYQFGNYCNRINRLMDDEDKLEVLGRLLKGWAGTWWRVIADRVKTYEEFRQKFLGQYWNIQIQRRVRDQLEYGKYSPLMRMSPGNYVLKIMAQVKHLTPSLDESDLVYKLSRHFTEKARVATVTRGVKTIEEFIMVIDECQDLERELQRTQVRVENAYPKNQERQQQKPWVKTPQTEHYKPKERRSGSVEQMGNPPEKKLCTITIDKDSKPSTSKAHNAGNAKSLQIADQ